MNSTLSWIKKNLDATVLIISILVVLLFAFQFGGWKQPLAGDRTFHLYSAQMIAKGAIPYIDFFNVHPPLGIMLIAFPMYLLPSLQSGAGPSIVHSVLTVLWSIGGIIALYFIAKKITGTWLGGLLSISFWMFLTPLFIRHYSVGQNRLLVTSSILIAMALLQRKKWYWAGFALACGFMTYYPTVLAGVAVIFVIVGQKSWLERFRCTAIFSAGFFTIVGMILLWLLYKGAFVAWFDVTLQWPFAMEITNSNVDKSILASIFDKHQGMLKPFQRGYKFWDINLLWVPILGVIGYVYYFCKSIARKSVKPVDLFFSKEIAPVFVTTFMWYLYLLVEKGSLDAMMLESCFTIWISFLLVDLASLLKKISLPGYWFSFAIISVVLAFSGYRLLSTMSSIFDRGMHQKWRNESLDYDGSVYLQTEASKKLFDSYSKDNTILVLGDLWFLNVTNRENPSHFYHTGRKMQLAAELAGLVTPGNNIRAELATLNSDLVLISKYRRHARYDIFTDQLLDMNYTCVGEASDVFILIPRDDIHALPAVFNMQQSFLDLNSSTDFDGIEILSVGDVNKIKNLRINEIAVGTLLLGYRVDVTRTNTITLYWWNWLDTNEQVSDIFIEVELNGLIIFRQAVNPDRFPKFQVIKQVIDLPDIENMVEEGHVVISSDGKKLHKFTCLTDFTAGPVSVPLSQ